MEYFSYRLHSLTKDYSNYWKFPAGLSDAGLITDKQGLTISRNYVNLAYDFGVLNTKNQTLGSFGRIFSKTETANNTLKYIKDHSSRSENILVLSDLERVLFLRQLLEVDGLAVFHIFKWLSELAEGGQDTVSRGVAMNHFMEELYPKMMETLYSSSTDYSEKTKRKKEAERAKSFRMERMNLEREGKWGMSDLYAKYRHMAPPRFEWLIDLGVLEKRGRGTYRISPFARNVYDIISKSTVDSFGDEAFYQLGKVYLNITNEASSDDVKNLLVDCYLKFEKAGHIVVDKILFENFVAFEALELQRKLVRITFIAKIIESIRQLDPRLVQYHVDISGKWRFVKISKDVSKIVSS